MRRESHVFLPGRDAQDGVHEEGDRPSLHAQQSGGQFR